MRQHLTAVQAAATVSRGLVEDAAVGSTEITLRAIADRELHVIRQRMNWDRTWLRGSQAVVLGSDDGTSE